MATLDAVVISVVVLLYGSLFYVGCANSISIRLLTELRRSPWVSEFQGLLMHRLFDVRLCRLLITGLTCSDGTRYHLTRCGRRLAVTVRLAKRILNVGPGG